MIFLPSPVPRKVSSTTTFSMTAYEVLGAGLAEDSHGCRLALAAFPRKTYLVHLPFIFKSAASRLACVISVSQGDLSA